MRDHHFFSELPRKPTIRSGSLRVEKRKEDRREAWAPGSSAVSPSKVHDVEFRTLAKTTWGHAAGLWSGISGDVSLGRRREILQGEVE